MTAPSLSLRPEWLEPGYEPATLTESPFEEMGCQPPFADVLAQTRRNPQPWDGSLESFAAALLGQIDDRYLAGPLGQLHQQEWGLPSMMDRAPHACTLAGLSTWCERLAADGYLLNLPAEVAA